MSSRLIEECFEAEVNEEYFILNNIKLLIVDPYMIDIKDLQRQLNNPDQVIPIRLRRPAWGQGDIHKYIHIVRNN